jgi:hypothetical protein
MKTITLAFVGVLLISLAGAYFGSDYGTSAYYSVVFDDRGLANVVLRLDYTNNGNLAADTIDLNIPGTDVKLAGAYMKKDCQYNGSNGYYDNCYYNPEFEPVSYEKIGANTYRLKLSEPLEKGHSTSMLVLYRAFGYAQGGVLGTGFKYETPKYGFDVDQTTVSIDVDQNLYLKEGGSNGNYRNALSNFNTVSAGSGNMQAAMSSMYSSGYYSYGYTTTKSTLLAGESVTVSGSYGKSKLLLYLPEAAVVLALLGAAGYFVKRKSEAQQKQKQEPAKQAGLGDAAIFSFMCAVAFSAVVSVAVLLGAALGVSVPAEGMQGVVLLVTIAWLAGAGMVHIYQAPRGRSLESALMFIGFSVVVAPFMLLVVWLIYSTMTWRPYYLYAL